MPTIKTAIHSLEVRFSQAKAGWERYSNDPILQLQYAVRAQIVAAVLAELDAVGWEEERDVWRGRISAAREAIDLRLQAVAVELAELGFCGEACWPNGPKCTLAGGHPGQHVGTAVALGQRVVTGA